MRLSFTALMAAIMYLTYPNGYQAYETNDRCKECEWRTNPVTIRIASDA